MESTLAVANFFIERGLEEGIPITPMKLQKLVYFAHGWHLAQRGVPLIDEKIQAWDFGPVIKSLYLATKAYGPMAIRQAIQDPSGFCPAVTNTQTLTFLKSIWDSYKDFSAVQLSNLTHSQDSPWSQAKAKTGTLKRNVVISNEMISDYYSSKLNFN